MTSCGRGADQRSQAARQAWTIHLTQKSTAEKLSSPRAKRASPKGERASRARAVTVSQCPHSEVGQDFLLRRRVTLTETAVTRKRKVSRKTPIYFIRLFQETNPEAFYREVESMMGALFEDMYIICCLRWLP